MEWGGSRESLNVSVATGVVLFEAAEDDSLKPWFAVKFRQRIEQILL